jgi:threonine/homoserine/homoserine lactone efflux protein
VIRSGFIPRLLGAVLIVGCFADLAVSVVSLLLPAYEQAIQPLRALGLGEILIILWLLIKGAQSEPADDQQLRPA